jgi:hypothetical protein
MATGGDAEDFASVARALHNSFPCVRVFRYEENRGFHFLASNQLLPDRTAEDLQSKMPASAVADFVECAPPPGGKSYRASRLQCPIAE